MANRSRKKLAERNGGNLYQGKKSGQIVFSFTDHAVPFDGGDAIEIPGKAALNNLISQQIMEIFNQIGIQTHFQQRLNMQEHLVLPCEPIPVKLVVRNYALGAFADNLGVAQATSLPEPIIEFRHDLTPNKTTSVPEQLVSAFSWADEEEVEEMVATANRANDVLQGFFASHKLTLAELHINFGLHYIIFDDDGFEEEEPVLVLIDQISLDTCRLLDQLQNQAPTGKDAAIKEGTLAGYRNVAERLGVITDSDKD